jgi:hypothetical protein
MIPYKCFFICIPFTYKYQKDHQKIFAGEKKKFIGVITSWY